MAHKHILVSAVTTLTLFIASATSIAGTGPMPSSYGFDVDTYNNSSVGYMTQYTGGSPRAFSYYFSPDSIHWSQSNKRISAVNVIEVFGSRLFAAGYHGRVAWSADAGSTWSQSVLGKVNGQESDTTNFVGSSFANADLGALLTFNGDLWLKNGNDIVRQNRYLVDGRYVDIDFNRGANVSSIYGWAIYQELYSAGYAPPTVRQYRGSGFQILEPADGEELPFPPRAICHIPSDPGNHAAIVGDDGQVAITLDRGLTWTSVGTQAPGYTLNDVHFDDTDHGYAIGTMHNSAGLPVAGVAIGTSDGGATWRILREIATSQEWSNFRIARRNAPFSGSAKPPGYYTDLYAWRTTTYENITSYVSTTGSFNELGLIFSEIVHGACL